jgi:hypothetical protein
MDAVTFEKHSRGVEGDGQQKTDNEGIVPRARNTHVFSLLGASRKKLGNDTGAFYDPQQVGVTRQAGPSIFSDNTLQRLTWSSQRSKLVDRLSRLTQDDDAFRLKTDQLVDKARALRPIPFLPNNLVSYGYSITPCSASWS